ncbi:hypothetical protein CF319_g7216 [Tilletia indica]|nr:hypothetical protein CF319_g7216 [Tilletia indica]
MALDSSTSVLGSRAEWSSAVKGKGKAPVSSAGTGSTASDTESERSEGDSRRNQKPPELQPDYSRVSGMRVLQPRKDVHLMTLDEARSMVTSLRRSLREAEDNLRLSKAKVDSLEKGNAKLHVKNSSSAERVKTLEKDAIELEKTNRLLLEDIRRLQEIDTGGAPGREVAAVSRDDAHDGGSSPPWLLENTLVEDYTAARDYAKGFSVDFFSDMRASMRAVLSEAGTSVDPGAFMALINDAGMKKTELVKLWVDGEDKYNTAAAKVVALEAKVDHLEVQLTLERARAVASTRELLELKGVVRVKNQQLGEAASQSSLASASATSKRAMESDDEGSGQCLVERRRVGGIVVKRVISQPASSGNSRK